jgi:hypothetical protein
MFNEGKRRMKYEIDNDRPATPELCGTGPEVEYQRHDQDQSPSPSHMELVKKTKRRKKDEYSKKNTR